MAVAIIWLQAAQGNRVRIERVNLTTTSSGGRGTDSAPGHPAAVGAFTAGISLGYFSQFIAADPGGENATRCAVDGWCRGKVLPLTNSSITDCMVTAKLQGVTVVRPFLVFLCLSLQFNCSNSGTLPTDWCGGQHSWQHNHSDGADVGVKNPDLWDRDGRQRRVRGDG